MRAFCNAILILLACLATAAPARADNLECKRDETEKNGNLDSLLLVEQSDGSYAVIMNRAFGGVSTTPRLPIINKVLAKDLDCTQAARNPLSRRCRSTQSVKFETRLTPENFIRLDLTVPQARPQRFLFPKRYCRSIKRPAQP